MPSRPASGESLRRIRQAFSNWHVSGYVNWKPACSGWVARELDATSWSTNGIARLLHSRIEAGAIPREQDETSGEYDQSVWYSLILGLSGRRVFVKFVLDPDDDDDPGIYVVSIHDQLS